MCYLPDAAGAVRHFVTGGQEVAVAAGAIPGEELTSQVIPAVGLHSGVRVRRGTLVRHLTGDSVLGDVIPDQVILVKRTRGCPEL